MVAKKQVADTLEDVGGIETPAMVEPKASEQMVPLSDVKRLIAEALMDNEKQKINPIKPKRVTEHTAHVWRFDGKWVVDFVDRNNDPYIKNAVHAFNKFNEQVREFEAWIELKFNDGTTKEVPLKRYCQFRMPVYCPIIKREKVDVSYVVGEVEKKKEVGDKLVGTGVMVDQEVNMCKEIFEVKTPEGEILKISDYVLA